MSVQSGDLGSPSGASCQSLLPCEQDRCRGAGVRAFGSLWGGDVTGVSGSSVPACPLPVGSRVAGGCVSRRQDWCPLGRPPHPGVPREAALCAIAAAECGNRWGPVACAVGAGRPLGVGLGRRQHSRRVWLIDGRLPSSVLTGAAGAAAVVLCPTALPQMQLDPVLRRTRSGLSRSWGPHGFIKEKPLARSCCPSPRPHNSGFQATVAFSEQCVTCRRAVPVAAHGAAPPRASPSANGRLRCAAASSLLGTRLSSP